MNSSHSKTCLIIGLILLATGLAVFGIRFTHAGAYSMPQGGALLGALGAIAIGGLLITIRQWRPLTWVALIISPVALFPALYSIMGEAEEVISLFATDLQGNERDLRLWIVDRDDGAWVGMPRDKALGNNLDGQQLSMLRQGNIVCVVPKLYDDRDTAGAIHAMKVAKYTVAQISGAIGLYPQEAGEQTVALRLDPCPAT